MMRKPERGHEPSHHAHADEAQASGAKSGSSNGKANNDDGQTSPGAGDPDSEPAELAGDAPGAPGQEDEGEAAPLEGELTQAQATAEVAKEEIAALRDQLLRVAADFDNYRKRSTREHQEARDYGITQLLHDILPVLDNLERALVHAPEGDKHPVVEGVRLVAKQFADTLTRYGVQSFRSVGVPFDPERHEAVAQVPVPNKAAVGTIVEEIQKGYTLRDRLLRPARVVVAAAPREPETTEASD